MTFTPDRLAQRWNWRLSAHMRLVSLCTTWLLVFGASVLPLVPVIAVLRLAFGTVQMGLNQALAKRSPLSSRDRWDWLLLLLAFGGSVAVAAMQRATGDSWAPAMLLVLVPYSVIQLRSFQRSLVAHAVPAQAVVDPLIFTPTVRGRAA